MYDYYYDYTGDPPEADLTPDETAEYVNVGEPPEDQDEQGEEEADEQDD